MSTPVLYFSNRCQFSLKLLDAIRSNEISTKNICIDFADDIPNNIKNVPSIIYKNKIYVGKGSFDLIKSLIDTKKSQGANTGIQPMDCIGSILILILMKTNNRWKIIIRLFQGHLHGWMRTPQCICKR